MAKIKQIVVSLGRKENDGNYGSSSADYSETIELEDGDDRVDVLRQSIKRAEKAIQAQLVRVQRITGFEPEKE